MVDADTLPELVTIFFVIGIVVLAAGLFFRNSIFDFFKNIFVGKPAEQTLNIPSEGTTLTINSLNTQWRNVGMENWMCVSNCFSQGIMQSETYNLCRVYRDSVLENTNPGGYCIRNDSRYPYGIFVLK